MLATLDAPRRATDITSPDALDFEVIKGRAAEMLDIPKAGATDIVLGRLFGLSRETVWRLRKGRKPSYQTVVKIAQALDMPIESLRKQGGRDG